MCIKSSLNFDIIILCSGRHDRHVLWPSQALPGHTDLDFKTADLVEMTKIGIEDAQKAVGKGRKKAEMSLGASIASAEKSGETSALRASGVGDEAGIFV